MNKEKNYKLFMSRLGNILDKEGVLYLFIQDEDFNYKDLKIGLISGFVGWSAYTFSIGENIIKRLSGQLSKNEITYYILDCDFLSNEIQLELFDKIRWGYFESCWLEHGEILKTYRLRPELEPFLHFMSTKLNQISNCLIDPTIMSYELDPNKPKLGIKEEAFQNKYEAIIRAKSKYKQKFLYTLMQYEEKGHYYNFEDDYLIVYSATTPSHLSSCYVRIKSEMSSKSKN